jgi:YidC/Oxa1 family membrane protein insertase
MDRRVFLAVVLTAIVIVITPLMFPNGNRPNASDSQKGKRDVTTEQSARGRQVTTLPEDNGRVATSHTDLRPKSEADSTESARVIRDTLPIESEHTVVWFSAVLGTPTRVELTDYLSRNPALHSGPLRLEVGSQSALLRYSLVINDTVLPLRNADFVASVGNDKTKPGIRFTGLLEGHAVSIEYGISKEEEDPYLMHVVVRVSNAPRGTKLRVHLPATLISGERDTADDIRHLAFGYKPSNRDVESIAFAKLDSGVTQRIQGPLDWIAVRNKYFLFALISPDSSIATVSLSGERRVGKLAPEGRGEVTLPLENDQVAFDLYTGPQEFERLRSLGYELDRVNPYAGWLHGVVQPFATVVTQVLLWMKRTSGLGYGWVIIIFGVSVRLLLWPLNQSAMRTSIRMQRLQPELTEVQRRYKNDPEKQREQLVKLYQSHGMTPFSPMMGCLPMLLPMPILFALYFVFLNTIEFRGVSFLWMRDISAADPYYITPIVMGVSMFALSWIGMRGTPPTAQTRMMSYMMPVVLTFMFFRFAAGLNLYYAVQNLAALPQQWLLARERAGIASEDKNGKKTSDGVKKGST